MNTDESGHDILQAMPDGVLIVDRDGLITYVNHQMERLSGYSAAELLGQKVEKLVPVRHTAGHRRHRRVYHRTEGGPRPMGTDLDITLRRKDGAEVPVDIALSPASGATGAGVVAAVRDVTERRRMESDLRASEERFRLMVEGVQDHALIMLDPKGLIMNWNPGAERINGYSSGEILGKNFSIFYGKADVRTARPARELEAAAATGHFQDECWRVRKDGSRFWASLATTALRDVNGKLRGFSHITRDSTERKRAQDRLEALLEVSQRMAAGDEPRQLLELIANRARQLVEAALVVMAVPGGEGELVLEVAEGDHADTIRGAIVPVDHSLVGEVARLGRPTVVDDLSADRRTYLPALRGLRLGPTLLIPMPLGGGQHGVLQLANASGGRHFDQTELTLLQLFAAQAAVAVDYARVQADLRRLAVVDERERIARDLHDGAIQSLFGVGMDLQGAALQVSEAQLKKRLGAAAAQIDGVIRDLRNYIFGLRPGILADRQLDQALRHLADDFQAKSGVVTAVEIDAAVAAELSSKAGDMVQLAREALSNVSRHARATTCRVTLRREAANACLEIEDDGRGFDPQRVRRGQGLGNLKERAARLGGQATIQSTSPGGSTVAFSIPLG